jgi:hypothetical protein
MNDNSMSDMGQTNDTASPRRSIRRWFAGGVVGLTVAALLLGGTAFAQTDESTTATDLGGSFMSRLAEKLGITADELEAAIDESAIETIDEAVAAGRLTEEQGERLKERVASTTGFRFFGPRGHFGGPCSGRVGVALDTVAATLNMSIDDLIAELRGGKTLSEIITERGSSVDAVVDALVAEAETRLAEKVADGDITQAQADAILAELPDRLTELIENGLPFGGRRDFRGPWFGPESDDATPEATGA